MAIPNRNELEEMFGRTATQGPQATVPAQGTPLPVPVNTVPQLSFTPPKQFGNMPAYGDYNTDPRGSTNRVLPAQIDLGLSPSDLGVADPNAVRGFLPDQRQTRAIRQREFDAAVEEYLKNNRVTPTVPAGGAPIPSAFGSTPAVPAPSIPQPQTPQGAPQATAPEMSVALPNGGFVSRTPGSLPEIEGGRTFMTPSGGEVTVPGSFGDYTPEERERIRAEMSGATVDMKRRIAERVQSKEIIKSLGQYGMRPDEIRKKIGAVQNPDMPITEAFRRLKGLQKTMREQNESPRIARKMKQVESEAEWDDAGVPVNESAQFMDLQTQKNAPIIGTDKTVGDYMTKSQINEFNRTMDKVAAGTAKEKDLNRLNKFTMMANIKGAQDTQKEAVSAARKTAKSEEQKEWLSNAKEQLKELGKGISSIESALKSTSIPSENIDDMEKRLKGLLDDQYGILEEINRRNTSGGVPTGQQQGAQAGAKNNQQLQSFASEEDARSAGFGNGDRVIIGGQPGTLR